MIDLDVYYSSWNLQKTHALLPSLLQKDIGLHITINHDYFAQIIVILEITIFFINSLHYEYFFQKLTY